ncbi:hypothetical protein GCM10023329_44290 [Streptomyces sanyensis]|uniref:Uncharacterized protein n=1 Tax=Streptomyces sanyensis TaxID=568869 RepID=A0ABP9AZ10_9ACTN
MSGTECAECAHLEREKETARQDHDMSRVSDCVVLLRRHPEHSEKPVPAGRGRA